MLKKCLILLGSVLLILSCPDPGTTDDSITLSFEFSSDVSIPDNGALILINSDDEIVVYKAAEEGTLEFSVEDEGSYELQFFLDTDSDQQIGTDEEYSVISLESVSTYTYEDTISCGIVYYSGTVVFHEDWPTTENRYILSKNIYLGTERMVSVSSDGGFSFYEKQMESGQKYSLSCVRDDDNDGEYSWKDDLITLMLYENGAYSDSVIASTQLCLSGTVDISELNDSSIYTTSPVISIEDQSYWATSYQYLASDNTFKVYVARNHSINICLNNTIDSLSDSVSSLEDELNYPVRLNGVVSYSVDTQILGATDGSSYNTDQNIRIHKLTVTVNDTTTDYTGKPLYLSAGQSALSFPVYSGTTQIYGSAGEASYIVPFRDFDRTTETSGLTNDSKVSDNTSGYGGFFHVQAFIDTNHDETLNPGEPCSNVYYWGDLDSDNVPTWDVDYDEEYSTSNVLEAITFSEDEGREDLDI
ncbi:MAG: hypothetical protein PQJ46_13890 [Spirochaetales bacterium]|nr:hypothetical protein [Spirochaetales bacterium]